MNTRKLADIIFIIVFGPIAVVIVLFLAFWLLAGTVGVALHVKEDFFTVLALIVALVVGFFVIASPFLLRDARRSWPVWKTRWAERKAYQKAARTTGTLEWRQERARRKIAQ